MPLVNIVSSLKVRWVIPSLIIGTFGLAIAIGSYIFIQHFEEEEAEAAFAGIAHQRMDILSGNLLDAQLTIEMLETFFQAHGGVDPAVFDEVAFAAMEKHRVLRSLAWVPEVHGDQLYKYYAEAVYYADSSFEIWEFDSKHKKILSDPGSYLYPVVHFLSDAHTKEFGGFNAASDPALNSIMRLSSKDHQTYMTTNVAIHPFEHARDTVAIVHPLYLSVDDGLTLSGYLLGFSLVSDLVENEHMTSHDALGVEFIIFDVSDNARPNRLFPKDSAYITPEDVHHPFKVMREIESMGRKWLVVAFPAAGSFEVVTWLGYTGAGFILTLSLMIVALIRVYTNRSSTLQSTLEQKTEDLTVSLAELAKAKEEAEQANKIKTEFLANMSHEIRTPLNGVLATAELLSEMQLSVKQKKYVDIIRSSGEMLLIVINDILDLSKIEAGKAEIRPTAQNIRKEIEIVSSLFAAQAASKRLSFSMKVSDDVPSRIVVDHFRLRQVISNLISNAIKYTSGGAVDAQLFVVDYDGAKKLRFMVTDTGGGVPIHLQQSIFDKFVQARRDEAINGTGLGLPICKSLVEMMGGVIGVSSDGAHGSTFWFEIPLIAADDLEDDETPAVEVMLTRVSHAGCRILLVEDIETNRIVGVEMLRELGCVIDTAENGEEAVEAVVSKDYDIVFMDCQMPVMNGYDATRTIRQKGFKNLPIIALTAHTFPVEVNKCLDAGMNDFISKPIKHAMLTKALDKWHRTTLLPEAAVEASVIPHACEEQQHPTQSAVLDLAALDELYSTLPDQVEKIIELSVKDSSRLYQELSQAIAQRDTNEINEAAHALKSVARQVGGAQIQAISAEIEALAEKGDVESSVQHFVVLSSAYQTFLEAMQEQVEIRRSTKPV